MDIRFWNVCILMPLFTLNGVWSLSGDYICVERQKYNVTKRIRYRAPVAVRSYYWCFSVPPRCSRWTTEMKDVTRLETEERSAEVTICCPGFDLKDDHCIPKCPAGKRGSLCDEDCLPSQWGPSCIYECTCPDDDMKCEPNIGECICINGRHEKSCSKIEEDPTEKEFSTASNTHLNQSSTLERSNRTLHTSTQGPFLKTSNDVIRDANVVSTTQLIEKLIKNTSDEVVIITSTYSPTNEGRKTEISVEDRVSVSREKDERIENQPDLHLQTSTSQGDAKLVTSTQKITSDKMPTTSKPLYVSIIPTLVYTVYKPKSNHSNNITKLIKHDGRKVNFTTATTSPIWHIFRIPSNNKNHSYNHTLKHYLNSHHSNITIQTLKLPQELQSTSAYTFKPSSEAPDDKASSENSGDSKISIRKVSFDDPDELYKILKNILDSKSPKFNREHSSNHSNSHTSFYPSKRSTVLPSTTSSPLITNITQQRTLLPADFITNRPIQNKSDSSYEGNDTEHYILTAPEQITAPSGRYPPENDESLIPMLAIVVGVTIILIASTILLVAIYQCRNTNHSERDSAESFGVENRRVQKFKDAKRDPLPEIPLSKSNYYKTIDSLQGDLKQFMRPVFVEKAVNPLMLDNFRDIIECHYDHLPLRQRSIYEDYEDIDKLEENISVTYDHLIDGASDCEKEPLYDEIPCYQIRELGDGDSCSGEEATEL